MTLAETDDWYGYCLDDPVNGVDPLGLETNGIGIGAFLDMFGLTGGGNIMVSEDDKGERVIEASSEHGISNGFGAGITGSYQKTNAKSVEQLKGKSSKIGGTITIPTRWGLFGVGSEHVKGKDYKGKNYNLSWGKKSANINSPKKPITGSIKRENTWTLKVPKMNHDYETDLW